MASAHEAEQIIRSLNGDIKPFTKAPATTETPKTEFRIYDFDRILIEYNDDGLTKADLEAICQPVPKEQTGGSNFRTIVVANRRVHIQSENFSFDFQHNIFDPEDSIMRPIWVSPTEIIPNNMTCITLYLHDQGSKEEVESLKKITHSQFEKLHDASLVFLKDIKWMRIEFLDSADMVHRSKVLQKKNVGKHGVCIDVTDGKQRTESQVYHFASRVDNIGAMQLFNFIPLRAPPLAVVLRFKNSRQWRLISHLTRVPPDAEDEHGKPLLDDPLSDSYLLHKYPVAAAAKLAEYGLATVADARLLELLEMDLKSPKPKMHTNTSRDWHIAMSRLLSKLPTNGELIEKLKSLPIVQLRDGSWTSAASGPFYFPTAGHGVVPGSLKFRDVTLLATSQPERRALYEQLGVIQPTVKQAREKILDNFKSSETLSIEDVYDYLRYLHLTHQSLDLFTPSEEPYDEVRVLTTDMKLQNPHSTTVYYPGTDDPYSPESLLGPASVASFLHLKIWNDGADKPGPFHPTWKVWQCDSIGIRERPSLLQPKAQSESEPTSNGSSTDADNTVLSDALHYLLKHPTLVSEIRQIPAQKLCGVDFQVSLQDTWVPSEDLKTSVKTFMVYPDAFPFLKLDEEKDVDLVIASRWSFFTKHFGVKWKHDLDFLLEIMKCIKRSCTTISSAQIEKVMHLYDVISDTYFLSTSEEKARTLEFFTDAGILYADSRRAAWISSSLCVWAGPSGLVTKSSIKRFYIEETCDKKQIQSIARVFMNELKIRYYQRSPNLKKCYLDLKDFFLKKLGMKISAYDELLNTTSDNPEDIKEMIISFADQVRELIPKFPAEPIRRAKIFPVRCPGEDVSLVSLDTDFAIADREGLRREPKDHIRILDFDLEHGSVKVPEDGAPSEELDPWDLRRKAYHITRVAATFNVFATYDHATSLYQRLKTIRIIEVSNISSELEIFQDQTVIRSAPQPTTAHISDDDLNFTIYMSKDKKTNIFSVLPRILKDWLKHDTFPLRTFEVVSSLASIMASDISVLDEILEDQGIIELTFENNDADVYIFTGQHDRLLFLK
ncbi:hypothetical protein DER46DRAFT_621964 [Fusarium sp. MPI-SDFR-AT-0072]|nr:hypothetical protein DER46DRAFT_621964 [Fusarium sp. MPI-SDFR-AT-0072]